MNNIRNEMECVLNERTYKLRATFFSLNDIEKRCKQSIPRLMVKASSRNEQLYLEDISNIIYGGMIGAEEKVTLAEVQELIMDAGLVYAIPIAVEFLTIAVQKSGIKVKEKKQEIEEKN